MSLQNDLKWYPVYTNPRAEKKAHELLLEKGIECYLPLQKQLKQWSDRKKWVEEPLLKSYIFVRIPIKAQTDVLMTRGICRFLYFSGKVASMPDRQIEQLKLLLATASEMEISDRDFQLGEPVMVIAGPLKGLRGELVTKQSRRLVLIRIDHLETSLLVKVPIAFLEGMSDSPPERLVVGEKSVQQ